MNESLALQNFVSQAKQKTFEADSQMLESNLEDLRTIFGKLSTFKYADFETFEEDVMNFALMLGEVYNEFYEGCEIDVTHKDCETLAIYICENLSWNSTNFELLKSNLQFNF